MNQVQLNQLKALVDTIKPEAEKRKPVASEFMGIHGHTWRVRRTARQVVFGCGAVKVNKSDLLVIANYLESQEKYAAALARLLQAWRKQQSSVVESNVLGLGSKKLRKLVG